MKDMTPASRRCLSYFTAVVTQVYFQSIYSNIHVYITQKVIIHALPLQRMVILEACYPTLVISIDQVVSLRPSLRPVSETATLL